MCVYVYVHRIMVISIILVFFFSSSDRETQYELEDRTQSGSHAGNHHGRIPIVLVAIFSLVRIYLNTIHIIRMRKIKLLLQYFNNILLVFNEKN